MYAVCFGSTGRSNGLSWHEQRGTGRTSPEFFEASDAEKDYSLICSFSPADAVGNCVYCNHCKPCPAGIDIGLVNKYYDLARNGDSMAAEHYHGLILHAEDCLQCGHCNDRCPFHVDQMARMGEIARYFC